MKLKKNSVKNLIENLTDNEMKVTLGGYGTGGSGGGGNCCYSGTARQPDNGQWIYYSSCGDQHHIVLLL